MQVDSSFVIGLFLAIASSILVALGNVFFKLQEIKRKQEPNDSFYLDYLAMALVIIGSITDVFSIGLLPLTINTVHSAIPIALGEIFSGCILEEKLNVQQWFLIVCILMCVIIVVLSGDHSSNVDVIAIFENHINSGGTIVMLILMALTAIASGVYIKVHDPGPDEVPPYSLFNIAGPIFVGVVGSFSQTTGKLVLEKFECGWSDHCEESGDGYYALCAALLVLAGVQILGVKFIMGKLNIITVIPLYGSVLILLPVICGVVFFKEDPTNVPFFILSLCLVLFFNWLLLSISQKQHLLKEAKKQESQEQEESVENSVKKHKKFRLENGLRLDIEPEGEPSFDMGEFEEPELSSSRIEGDNGAETTTGDGSDMTELKDTEGYPEFEVESPSTTREAMHHENQL